MKSGGLTVSRTTGAGRRARRSSQRTDRARLSPLSDVRVEPGDGVLAQLPPLWKFASELETVDGHSRETSELHYRSYAKELHVDISCDVPFSGEPSIDARGRSLAPALRKVIPVFLTIWTQYFTFFRS